MPTYDKNLGPYCYSEDDVLGKGAYGSVYRAYDTRINNNPATLHNTDLPASLRGARVVALKAMSNPNVEDGLGAATLREILMLKELQMPRRSDERANCVLNFNGSAVYRPENRGEDSTASNGHGSTITTPRGKTRLFGVNSCCASEVGSERDVDGDDDDEVGGKKKDSGNAVGEHSGYTPASGRKYVMRLYDVIVNQQDSVVFASIELCEGGDLWGYLRKQPNRCLRDPAVFKRWMREVTLALAYLHSRRITHRDMKPQNIMLQRLPQSEIDELRHTNSTNVLVINSTDDSAAGDGLDPAHYCMKVADFGLSRLEGIPIKKYVHEAVTLWYRSPDVLLGSTNYSFSADAWSLGCIIAEVASGSAPFRGRDDKEQFKRIFARIGGLHAPSYPSMHSYPHSEAYEDILARVTSYYTEETKRGMLAEEEARELEQLKRMTTKMPSPYIEHLARIKAHMRTYFDSHAGMDVLGEEGLDLVSRLLIVEPSKRLSVTQAIEHPFFRDGPVTNESHRDAPNTVDSSSSPPKPSPPPKRSSVKGKANTKNVHLPNLSGGGASV